MAEDEPDLRELVVLLLRRDGHQVTAVADGLQALELLDLGGFDLVVTDHHMPRVTGVQVAQHLARSTDTIKVLLMSGDHRLAVHDVVTSGRAAFLPKPFNATTLRAAVRALISAGWR